MGHALDVIVPIAAAVVGTALGGPIGGAAGAALGSGGVNYSQTHNFGSALKAGALGGAGSFIGGNLGQAIGPNLGTVGSTLDSALGASPGASSSSIGEFFGGNGGEIAGDTAAIANGGAGSFPWQTALPAASGGAASSSIASALGSGIGNSLSQPISGILGSTIGSNFAGQFAPPGQPKMAGNYPFVPSQAAAAVAPKSINSMSSLTPQQQASGLATQGLYGGGLGPQEQSYFGNLINRQLVDQSGAVSPLSSLLPIETSYLNKLGFGGQANSNSLLEALSKWNPSNQNA